MDFTYRDYKDMLVLIKTRGGGYQFCSYNNYKNVENPCILRHDIDLELQKAVCFAELEAGMGIKSTYFVLVNTNFYNVFSAQSRKLLGRIKACGHEIGLHFDEMQYEICGNWELLCKKIGEEADMLSSILGSQVRVVSMHRPSKGLLEEDLKIPGLVNSYQHIFFREFKYFSDSRMHWQEDVVAGIDKEKNKKLHILTHPFWYGEEMGSLKSRLSEFINRAGKERYEWLDMNFRELGEVLKYKILN